MKDTTKNSIDETFETLSEIKYGDLKAKFEELGVGEVWKPGKKGADLINSALDKLSEISGQKKIEAEEAKIVEEKEEEVLISKEEIEIMIAKLQRAVGAAIASHKKGLLVRLETFEKMLDKGHYIKESNTDV